MCSQSTIEIKFQLILSKIHPWNSVHSVSVKAVFYVLTFCTLFMSLKKNLQQRHVLILSTQYQTHPGCSQTPIELYFQSTPSKIHPWNSIHSVAVKAVFYVLTLCTLFQSLQKQFWSRLVLVLSI